MANSGKGFRKQSLLNSPTQEIFKTQKDFINDCFELIIFCVKNKYIDANEMVSFAMQIDGDQLGDNNDTDAKIKSLISNGCDPSVAYKLGIILTYLEISELTDRINKKLDRRNQTEFDTARAIAMTIDCFMLHDSSLDDDRSDRVDRSKTDVDLLIITRLKKAMLKFA
jgi:hypothetical protein